MRDKLSEAVKKFDAILKPDGRIIYLGTPQNKESLYNKLPDRGYRVSICPARYPNEDQSIRYGSKLALLIDRNLRQTLQSSVNLQTLNASQISTF